ncbi:hypothetical protein HNP84_000498 [Thermocatellispora tengchongensis]|uniref:Uncharacterized protein n=1 Tax=Thermocatellispora tengchongensis TaxID=1073253 RepID=A0A840P048_9ACTN|nr:hypothetical protein [Thermocatellispora tengchongensis]MBB5130810.1 hypothetical protein [Thermocatellispora tengchongensis]
MRGTSALTGLAVAGLSAVLVLAPAPPVLASAGGTQAVATPDDDNNNKKRKRCRPDFFVKLDDLSPMNFFIPRTRFIDGPGGTITATVERETRVYAEIEIEREQQPELTRRDIIRRFRLMINPLLAEEHVVRAGHQYTHEISKGKYGNLWYRVFGYRVGFTAWRQLGTCRLHRVTSGVASVPARVEGWKYWETDHPVFRGRRLH